MGPQTAKSEHVELSFFFIIIQPQECAAGLQKTQSLGDNSIFNAQAWQLELVWGRVIWKIQLRI